MKKNLICLITAALIIVAFIIKNQIYVPTEEKDITVGYIYVGDESTAYTKNFVKAQNAIEATYGDKVINIAKYNISEGEEEEVLQELVDDGCDIIFATSYGYSDNMKKYAEKYPDVQFCQATGDNAASEPVLTNYHTYMGHISEGRYICGMVAGMKMQEMIDQGIITEDQAIMGYVGAYPYPEVISGFTAFLLGARIYCPTAVMQVVYTDSWGNFALEKEYAEGLIDNGCIIISQHSDTRGPAIACEESEREIPVYHVGYNQSMMDVAPTTSLAACRINWEPYMLAAVHAVMLDHSIESEMEAGVSVHGNDAGVGFSKGWVQMLDLNELVIADQTKERVSEAIDEFKRKKVFIYKGNYTGVDPFDTSDTVSLGNGAYKENLKSSAPTFHYILDDVVQIVTFE